MMKIRKTICQAITVLIMVLGILVLSGCENISLAELKSAIEKQVSSAILSSNNSITEFLFEDPYAIGVIDEGKKTVSVEVPFVTDRSSMVPTIVVDGVSISPKSGVARDFSSPIDYSVLAENGSSETWVVTVDLLPANTYNVSFDSNAGTAVTGTIEVTYGSPYGTLPTTTRIYYDFNGWYTDGNVLVTSTSTVNINSNHTLTANWSLSSHTVLFDEQGGSSVDNISVTNGDTYNQDYGWPDDPTQDGHTFMGWWTGVDGTGTEVSGSDSVWLTADQTLYAYWVVDTYTLTTLNGSNGSISPLGTYSVDFDEEVTLIATPNTGYGFTGWIVNGDGASGLVFVSGSISTTPATIRLSSGDVNIQPSFSILEYDLTMTSGASVTMNPASGSVTTVEHGSATNISITELGTIYDSYTKLPITRCFTGWTSDDDGVSFADASEPVTTVTLTGGDATIKAELDDGWLLTVENSNGESTISTDLNNSHTIVSVQSYYGAGGIYNFWYWTCDEGSVTFSDYLSYSTTVMATDGGDLGHIVVRAVYSNY